ELPDALDALVARMLAKDRSARPRDGSALLGELEEIGEVANVPPPAHGPPAVTGGERRLLGVILARPAPPVVSAVQAIAERFDGDAAALADGTLLVTFARHESATDLAAHAASCALAIRAAFENLPLALATGRGETSARHPVGPAIDRAAALLGETAADAIPIDDVTAGLLEERFDIRTDGVGRRLAGKRAPLSGARTLLA